MLSQSLNKLDLVLILVPLSQLSLLVMVLRRVRLSPVGRRKTRITSCHLFNKQPLGTTQLLAVIPTNVIRDYHIYAQFSLIRNPFPVFSETQNFLSQLRKALGGPWPAGPRPC